MIKLNEIKIVADSNDKQGNNGLNKSDLNDKKAFPKADYGRKRAVAVFDILDKYKDKKMNREEIIKQLFEPVVREEMELGCKRCFE